MDMEKQNLHALFASFSDFWSPKIAGEINGMHLKLAKLKGEFVWRHHELEDELFLVVSGELLMRFRDKDVRLSPGEFIIVPRGVEHLPIAEQECHIVLIEPKTTRNTGNLENKRTVAQPERIA